VKIYQHPRLFDQRTQDRPVRRNAIVAGLPWMAITDALGLFAALAIVGLLNGLETAADRSFVLTLLVISTLLSVLFSQVRTLETIMKGRRVAVIGVPILAAIIAGALQYVGRVVRLDEPPDDFIGYDIVVSDPTEAYDPAWLRWMSHANMYGIKVLPAPLVFETLTGRVPFEMLDGRWAFDILNGRSPYRLWKRAFDVTAVVLTAPFSLLVAGIVALIVLFDTGRPILFWQHRVGYGGRPFRMVKFRTMRTDAETNGDAFATMDDSRVTTTGRFLRQYRLDEIPQLWNVLRGDMSVIGPRPEQLSFAKQFGGDIPLYDHRHSVAPGITGWAQVNDGYAASVDETRSKLRHDFFYVKHCSLHLDILIVWRTIVTVMTGFGSR
jgi:lipopolysaccharide/colanic/teichoic acid biosynthesis glycosyltransferase